MRQFLCTWVLVAAVGVAAGPDVDEQPKAAMKKAAPSAQPVDAGDVKAVITAPGGGEVAKQVKIGDAIVLSAEKSITGNQRKSYTWNVKPADRLQWISADGIFAVLGPGYRPGKIEATLYVSKGDIGDFTQLAITSIATETPAGPPPEDDPDDGDEPTTPAPPVSELAALVGTWVSAVDAPDRPAKATAIAAAIKTAAADIGKQDITTAAQISLHVMTKVRDAANKNGGFEPWTSVFSKLTGVMDTYDVQGKLKTPADYKTFWLDTANGFETR